MSERPHQAEIYLTLDMLRAIFNLPASYSIEKVTWHGQEVVFLVESPEIPAAPVGFSLPLLYFLYRLGDDTLVTVMNDHAFMQPETGEPIG